MLRQRRKVGGSMLLKTADRSQTPTIDLRPTFLAHARTAVQSDAALSAEESYRLAYVAASADAYKRGLGRRAVEVHAKAAANKAAAASLSQAATNVPRSHLSSFSDLELARRSTACVNAGTGQEEESTLEKVSRLDISTAYSRTHARQFRAHKTAGEECKHVWSFCRIPAQG